MSDSATAAVRTQHTARRARLGIVGLLVIGLLISGFSRQWAMGLQRKAYLSGPYAPAQGAGGDSADGSAETGSPALGSLDSYFLVLLLGGLRGPLVMFLWTSSESQKNERDLEDFDTKVEMIRLLQPEFDSVHIFQMWNKAYNISAQVASLPNKYAIILDAVEYGKRVDKSRPNNLNVLLELNKIYQHKLGSTAVDSVYYHRKVREDSKWREPRGNSVGALEQRMKPVLDKDGNILPELVTPRVARPGDLKTRIVLRVKDLEALKAAAATAGVQLPADQLSPGTNAREMIVSIPETDARKIDALVHENIGIRFVYADWNDGSDLQYLKRYGPYPYGVSPLALGYNYGKRAQVLMNRTGQRPAQSGPSVVDSRPGLELRQWGETEWDRGIAAEARAFGRPTRNGRHEMLLPTATLPPIATPLDGSAYREAVLSMELANRLARDARAEYTRHLINTTDGVRRMQDYTSHLETLEADELMTRADLTYIRAISASSAEKRAMLPKARGWYAEALSRYQAMDLRYYIPGEAEILFFPPTTKQHILPDWRNVYAMAGLAPGITRETTVEFIDRPAQLTALHQFVSWAMESFPQFDQTKDARQESAYFIQRADLRMAQIDRALQMLPATARNEGPQAAPVK